jgi:hypothetical protein
MSTIILSLLGGGLYVYQQESEKKRKNHGENSDNQKKEENLLIPPEFKNSEHEESIQPTSENLEKYDEYPGWLWDKDNETWIPDPEHEDTQ